MLLVLNPFATPTIYVQVHNRPSQDLATTHFNGNLNRNSCASSYAVPFTKNAKPRSGMLLRSDDNTKASTWWLDVLSPTDQEMKLLSKVLGIHPLTTEDILMEEIREKIELFRNYYLVCFHLFDQDPYSPTYPKPLNIYIIVFREGTLLYSYHHFPPVWKKARPLQLLHSALVSRLFWIRHVQSIPAPHPCAQNGPGTPELETIQQTQSPDADSRVLPNLFVKILSSNSVLEVPAGSEIELEKLATPLPMFFRFLVAWWRSMSLSVSLILAAPDAADSAIK
ncbi:hypothetical protein PtA15_7A387 [Puccinia triticina]|uniref:Uncharacterized protein n=1 Tax=Puccinia triticina TaxID=208348 RepID=A0ABY7CNC4_9BASI|nr:uncharacterized protein PtA15_7A387 [Puccinia triticina]WAQ86659.1 hypothetical protein PtA15_7A387 [Puccinia triticina]